LENFPQKSIVKLYGLITNPVKIKIWGDIFKELVDVTNSSQTF